MGKIYKMKFDNLFSKVKNIIGLYAYVFMRGDTNKKLITNQLIHR